MSVSGKDAASDKTMFPHYGPPTSKNSSTHSLIKLMRNGRFGRSLLANHRNGMCYVEIRTINLVQRDSNNLGSNEWILKHV